MRTVLKASGVLEHQLNIVPKEYKTKTLATAFDWLHDVYLSHEYARVYLILKSVPPEVWENYKLLGVEDLTEQKLLSVASKKLIRIWKTKRPRLFINRQIELCEKCIEKAVFTYKDSYKKCENCGDINEQDSTC